MKKYELNGYEFVKVRVDHKPLSQGQLRVIIPIKFVELESPMLHADTSFKIKGYLVLEKI